MPLFVASILALPFFAACSDDQTGASGSNSTALAQQEADAAREKIRQCFNGYMAAVLDSDGEAAADFVTNSTLQKYETWCGLALNATILNLDDLLLLDSVTVLMFRTSFEPEDLKIFARDGYAAFKASADAGMISPESVASLSLGEIQIQHSAANGVVVNDGTPTDLDYEFRLENGEWKLNLLPTLRIANLAFEQVREEVGLSNDDFLIFIVSQSLGRNVDDSIFVPISDQT